MRRRSRAVAEMEMERKPAVPADDSQGDSGTGRDAPKPPPVRITPLVEAEEMGGEQPCQAHQFWGLEDE